MGVELCQRSAAARELFSAADELTGLPLTTVCHEGPRERLTRTEFAQPAVVATSLAASRALAEQLGRRGLQLSPTCCAGHSVGELAAFAVAGAFTIADCLTLVAARGRLMAEASETADGSMAAIIGLDESALAEICSRASKETSALVQIANLNAPGQIVLSGDRRSLALACELAQAAGAKRVVQLDVSGPFHSAYMQPAAERFRSAVERIEILRPAAPVVLNVTAQPCVEPDAIREELVTQVTSPVRWSDSVKTMLDMGCTIFVELGPGRVLSGLVKRIARDATTLSVEDGESLDTTVEKLCTLL